MLNEFEKKIKEKLSAVGFRIIKGYEGQFSSKTYKEILGIMPCALVIYGGGEFKRQNLLRLRQMKWNIIIGCESIKKDKARLGMYELLEETKNALDGAVFHEFDMKPLLIQKEEPIYNDDRIIIFGQVYKTLLRERSET